MILRTFAYAAVLSLSSVATAAAETLFIPDDPQFTGIGKVIYQSQCAACHGVDLQGEPDWRQRKPDGKMPAPPHDETGHTWHHSERQLFEITKFGLQKFAGPNYQTDMPAYESTLTDSEILAVLSYIKSTWPEDIRTRHDMMSRQ